MSEQVTNSKMISPEYEAHLKADYGDAIAASVANEWQAAPLLHQPGQVLPYVRIGETVANPDQKPALFVPGFTGGIVANAPFGAALASRGFDVILPDQNRAGILKNPAGERDVTYNQALNLAALIEYEGLTQTPLDVVTHSYGSLVFDSLSKYAVEQGWQCFDGAKAALLAPAGIKQDERVGTFLKRYGQLFLAGSKYEKAEDTYWRHEKEMFASGQAIFTANIPRALFEGLHIIRDTVDLSAMAERRIGTIALVPFPKDPLFGLDALTPSIEKLLSDNVTSFSAVSLTERAGSIRGARDSDHADQQFDPERVAGAVAQFLRY